MTKDDALKIIDKLGNSPNLKNHGIAAGHTMAEIYNYFKNSNKNPELTRSDWEIVGLLHDADYEKTEKSLELHTDETTKELKKSGANKLIIDAIRGHCDKEERKTLIAKAIYACDELTGLIVACALVKPDKKLKSVTPESIKKKFKDNSFAKGANRDQIKTCENELEISLNDFIKITFKAMQKNAKEINL